VVINLEGNRQQPLALCDEKPAHETELTLAATGISAMSHYVLREASTGQPTFILRSDGL
jgi:hypothetical protein